MKKIIIPVLGLLALAMPSCKKYLDLVPKGQLLVETAQDYYDFVSYPGRGYIVLNLQYLSDNNWIREFNVIGANKTLDVVHFTGDTVENRVNLISSSNFYSRAYLYISRWNTIISQVDEARGEESIRVLAKAEAKVFRAFDYFHLINTYAKAYHPGTAATDGGVPMMYTYDLEATPKKGTVKEAYDLIQKDLDEAIPHLQATPKDPYHPSLAFAWALKAKVHLFKREWSEAKDAALKSLSYNDKLIDLVDLSAKGGPTVVNTPAAANPEVLSLMFVQGYNEMNFAWQWLISPELVQLFGTNDARYNLFFRNTNGSYMDLGSGAAYWQSTFTQFFYPTVGMKTGDVYLILAEAYARENNISGAMDYLNRLRKKRILDATAEIPVPATAQEAMQYIITERRKELLFGFNRFFDLKRYNLDPEYAKTIERKFPVVNQTVPQQTYTIKPNSRLYVIPFPADVLKLNRALTLNTDETIPF